jgi:2-polyprenyl-6-hydroxyphenyl methylase/3-demethylubiquinone-9 3-methyltransferase
MSVPTDPPAPAALGPRLRRLFGPLERPVAELYRACFLDLGRLAATVRRWAPAPESVLEVGCGEGALLERLARAYPAARLTGIDITPRAGRLFRGDRGRVEFHRATVEEFVPAHLGRFDLALTGDVLHHVPWPLHERFLAEAARALRPGGRLVVKDWERRPNLAHLLGYCSDRYLTGDRIRYATAAELRALLRRVFGPGCIERECRLPPWPNNVMFLVRPAPEPV